MAYCRIEVIPRSWSLATLAGGLKNDLLMTVPYPQLHNWEQSKTSRETNQAPLQMQMNVEDSSHIFLHHRILAVNHRQLFLGLFCFSGVLLTLSGKVLRFHKVCSWMVIHLCHSSRLDLFPTPPFTDLPQSLCSHIFQHTHRTPQLPSKKSNATLVLD